MSVRFEKKSKLFMQLAHYKDRQLHTDRESHFISTCRRLNFKKSKSSLRLQSNSNFVHDDIQYIDES